MKQRYFAFAALVFLILMGACSTNQKIDIRELEKPPSAIELARAAADEGTELYENKLYDAAIQVFEKANSLFAEALETAAIEDSVEYNMEIISLNIAKSHADLALDNTDIHLYDDALRHYEKALDIYINHEPVRIAQADLDQDILGTYKNLAIVSQKAGNYEDTIEYYDEILKREPNNEDILNAKFHVLNDNLKDETRAFEVLTTYAEVANSAPAYLMLAENYTNTRNFAAAEAAYMKALELKEDADMYARLGNFFRTSNQWAKANTYLEKLIATNPDNQTKALVYKQLGLNYKQLGNNQKMTEYWEKAVDIDNDANTALSLASHYNSAKNWTKVVKYAGIVIASEPNNATARMLRGVAYVQQKNYASARTDLERIQNDNTYGDQVQGILKSLPKN